MIDSVYYPESNLTLDAIELRLVEDKAVVLVQDRICIAELVNEVWTISSANECVLDLCDILWKRLC